MKAVRTSLLLFMLLLLSGMANASHMVGADISYKCINSNGDYKVTLTYYRDCGGIPTCSGSCTSIASCTKTMQVRGADASCNGTLLFTFSVAGKSVRDAAPNVGPKCANGKSICDNMGCITAGSLTPAYERYDFEGVVNLGMSNSLIPTSCCKVSISFEECCRNGAIQNITPGNFYTEAMVNRCLAQYPNCNSPVLTNDPVAVLCAGQGFIYNYGAFDPDLDSLLYSFTPSLEGYGVTSTYVSPFNYNEPLPYKPPFSANYPFGIRVDPVNGDIKFTPNAFPFTGVCAIQIQQWRKINGIFNMVGTTRRDLQMYIKQCPTNNPPTLRTIPYDIITQPKTEYTISPDSIFCFTVIAKDTDYNPPSISDTTYLSWNNVMAQFGATFVPNYNPAARATNGPREDSYKFCWQPQASMANTNPYTFTINALDNRCVYAGIVNRQFNIKVVIGVVNPGITKSVKCATASLSHTTAPSAYSSKVWKVSLTPDVYDSTNLYTTTQQTFNLAFQKAGRYPIQMAVIEQSTGKSAIFRDTITITRLLRIKNNDTTLCGTTQNLLLTQVSPDSSFRYRWYKLPDTTTVLGTADTLPIKSDKSKSIMVQSYDSAMACYFRDTFNLKAANLHANVVLDSTSPAIQCFNKHRFLLKNLSMDSAANAINYVWTFSDGAISTSTDTLTKSFGTDGAKWVRLVMYSTFGCKDTAMFTDLLVHPSPKAKAMVFGDTVQCQSQNQFTFTNQSTGAGDSSVTWWNFGTGPGDTSNLDSINRIYLNAGTYPVKLVISTKHNCADTATRMVKVNPSPVATYTISDSVLCSGKNLSGTSTSSITSGTIKQKWYFGDNTTDSASTTTHNYLQNGNYMLQLIVTSNLNCKDSSSRSIVVHANPVATFTLSDSVLCAGKGLLANSTSSIASGSISTQWFFGDSATDSTVATTHDYTTAGTYVLKLLVKSDQSCVDSSVRMISVNAQPIAAFTLNNWIVCEGQSLLTNNTSTIGLGSITYTWTFGDNTNDTSKNPMHSYSQSGAYPLKLLVTSDQNCRDSAFMNVQVNPQPKSVFIIIDTVQCLYDAFVFANSTILSNGTFSSVWRFGDGEVANTLHTNHSYANAGTYAVKLIVTSDQNCIDSSSKNIYALAVPVTPMITGDTVAPKLSTRVYSVLQNNGSIYTWASIGDTASPLTVHILPVVVNQVTIPWGNVDWGGLAVMETDTNTTCHSDTAILAVRLTPGTGIASFDGKDQIIIYPQPASDKLMLSGNTDALEKAELRTVDGRLLRAFAKEDLQHKELPVNAVETGVYLLYFTDGNGQGYAQKVSIVK